MSRHPALKWAQRSDKVFISIELPDAKDVQLKLEPEGKFFFSANSGPDRVPYEIDITLHDQVDVKESKSAVGLRNICYLVKKAEKKWWSRLLKQEGKAPIFVKVDWDKWIDEEDEDRSITPDMDFGDMDFSKLSMDGPDEFDDEAGDEEGDDDEMEEVKSEDDIKAAEDGKYVAEPKAVSSTQAEASA